MENKRTTVAIHFDGACHNKPQSHEPMGIGVAVFINESVEPDSKWSGAWYVGEGTSNVAEWKACAQAMLTLLAMKKLPEFDEANFAVYADSQLVAFQFNGKYKINKPFFQTLKDEAVRYAKLAKWHKQINWVRRENKRQQHADDLSKEGLRLGKK